MDYRNTKWPVTDFNIIGGDKLELFNSSGINFDKNSIQLTENGFKISEGNNNFFGNRIGCKFFWIRF